MQAFFKVLWAHLSLFKLISAHASRKNLIYIKPHKEDAQPYEERELRLINLKAFRGEVGFHPIRKGAPLFS